MMHVMQLGYTSVVVGLLFGPLASAITLYTALALPNIYWVTSGGVAAGHAGLVATGALNLGVGPQAAVALANQIIPTLPKEVASLIGMVLLVICYVVQEYVAPRKAVVPRSYQPRAPSPGSAGDIINLIRMKSSTRRFR